MSPNSNERREGQVFVDNTLARNRVITLRNIAMWYDDGSHCTCTDKICAGWCPEISCAGPLFRLITENPDINDYTFDPQTRAWSMTAQ